MNFEKKKKDFKLSAEIVEQFERLAPSGKQTAIVEQLIGQWVMERQREERAQNIRRAYERSTSKASPKTGGKKAPPRKGTKTSSTSKRKRVQ